MERVFFADSYEQVFADKGLKTFDDIYNCDDGQQINKNTKRNVSVLRFKTKDGEKKFFLKRLHDSHFKDMLFVFMNTGKIVSQAAYEWGNISRLAKVGVGAPTLACYGEKLLLGIERKSFIITQELDGQCLTDFVAQNWAMLPQLEKEKIIISLAKNIRKIHDAQISLPDLYVWHIFISPNANNDYNFAFIDLNRMKRNMWNKGEKVENLGRLHHSMLDKYFDKPLRKLLIEAYADEKKQREIENLIRRVEKYSRKFSARRKVKLY
ncbi:MAG: lipopolysaccharide kinase InaA family protein [Planctomycetaceae bacterium]|nr:lipopolysaccharide kinase InaA family protein [Planctomycetaceae bacterium]